MGSSNVSTVTLTDGRIVLLSYGRPVATAFPAEVSATDAMPAGIAYRVPRVQCETRCYSRTTTRHINAFARQHGALIETIDESTFNAAIAPLAR